MDKTMLCKGDEVTVYLKVKNMGEMDGEEVVQLYIRDMESDVWMANKQLREFERIALKKGKKKLLD